MTLDHRSINHRMRAAFLLGVVILAWTIPARAIQIPVSIKAVLNPADGARTSGLTDAQIDTAITAENALLATYWRGYQIVRVDPITNVGAKNNTTGPSKYYNINFQNPTCTGGTNAGKPCTAPADCPGGGTCITQSQMESDAKSNKALYAWNDFAINFYLVNGFGGGSCANPDFNLELIAIGQGSGADGAVMLHETGHYFGLCHTQGCSCSCCDNSLPGGCTTPGDDGIGDTLPDVACWSPTQISSNAFAKSYNACTADERRQVDDVFNNLLSYHPTICGTKACSSGGNNGVGCTLASECPGGSCTAAASARLTEQQLDKWTDVSNDNRQGPIDGRTRFVDRNGNPNNQTGSSTAPFVTFLAAYNAATAGKDEILLRPGAYDEHNLFLTKAVVIRATRQGPVAIGSATVSAAASEAISNPEVELRDVPGLFPTAPVHFGFAVGQAPMDE